MPFLQVSLLVIMMTALLLLASCAAPPNLAAQKLVKGGVQQAEATAAVTHARGRRAGPHARRRGSRAHGEQKDMKGKAKKVGAENEVPLPVRTAGGQQHPRLRVG